MALHSTSQPRICDTCRASSLKRAPCPADSMKITMSQRLGRHAHYGLAVGDVRDHGCAGAYRDIATHLHQLLDTCPDANPAAFPDGDQPSHCGARADMYPICELAVMVDRRISIDDARMA